MTVPDATENQPSTDGQSQEIDALYEAFLPRLVAARRSYLRTRLAAVMLLPLMFGAGVALAASDDDSVAQVANGDLAPAPTVESPKQQIEAAEEKDGKDAEPLGDHQESDKAGEAEEVEFAWVEIGEIGRVQVGTTSESVVVGEKELAEGWEGAVWGKGNEDSTVLVLSNGTTTLLATLFVGDGGIEVEIKDITPEPDPTARKEIPVGEVGTVVVESNGEKLFLEVTWSHEWWKPVVVRKQGQKVRAHFTNDGFKFHVEAWLEGDEIAHRTWLVEPEEEDPKEEPKEEPKEQPKEEPEIQTRKEIYVGEVGKVVVEREGNKLWLGVVWHHEWYDPIIVNGHGPEVSAFFTNDGAEHYVRAWIKGNRIKHETWVNEPATPPYDGTVSCGFGTVGVLVEGNIARVVSVQEVEGVEAVVVQEVGEHVKVRFVTGEGTWLLEAWGNGETVVSECGPVS